MSKGHPPPPRGIEACIEALAKRRDWVAGRAGGTYDTRETIALSYAIGLLTTARTLGLVSELETFALEDGLIEREWLNP